MKKIKTYNKFVDYYDEIIRGEGYSLDDEVFFINELIENNYSKPHPNHPPGGPSLEQSSIHLDPLTGEGINVLEFACGTGTIARELEKKGYDIFGVDLSEQMIKKANSLSPVRREYPKGEGGISFIVGDMTSINLEKQFDVVLCNYNSVCHLNSWEDWQKFFKNAYKHLKSGGILIFDILTIFEFENITRDFRGFFNVSGDTICLEMFSHSHPLPSKEGSNYYKWLIKMFVNKGNNNFELIEEEIKEISFPVEDIKKELEKTGFKIKHLEDFALGEVNNESERVYFVVEK